MNKFFFCSISLVFSVTAMNVEPLNKEFELARAILAGNSNGVAELVKKGASISNQNAAGMTPFMLVACQGTTDTFVKMCLYACSPEVFAIQDKDQPKIVKSIHTEYIKTAFEHYPNKVNAIEIFSRPTILSVLIHIPEERHESYIKSYAQAYTDSQCNFIKEALTLKDKGNKTAKEIAIKKNNKKAAAVLDQGWVIKNLREEIYRRHLTLLCEQKNTLLQHK